MILTHLDSNARETTRKMEQTSPGNCTIILIARETTRKSEHTSPENCKILLIGKSTFMPMGNQLLVPVLMQARQSAQPPPPPCPLLGLRLQNTSSASLQQASKANRERENSLQPAPRKPHRRHVHMSRQHTYDTPPRTIKKFLIKKLRV